MAEVLGIVSAALGLLPILVEAVRGCRTLRTVASSLKKVFRTLVLDLDVQSLRFLNECELLLRTALKSDHDARTMVDNPDHQRWHDTTLDEALASSLSRSYSLCIRIITGIQEAQLELKEQLSSFDAVHAERRDGESLRSAYRRVRQTASLGFDKKDIEEKIQQLRSRNEDLETLRRQSDQLRQLGHSAKSSQATVATKLLPSAITEIREINREAHTALSSTFSCKENDHAQHWAAICVNDEVGYNKLNLTLSYFMSNEKNIRCQKDVTLCLHSDKFITPGNNKRASVAAKTTIPKKIRFADEPDIRADDSDQGMLEPEPSTIDLSSIENTCNFLEQNSKTAPKTHGFHKYLGYLQTSQSCRHIFYVYPSNHPPTDSNVILLIRQHTLRDLLLSTKGEPVSLKYQLSWAVKLTLAVLKFHSTPWLQDNWRTTDLLLPTLELSTMAKPSLFLKTDLPNKRTTEKSLAGTSEVDAIMTDQDGVAAHIILSEDYDECHYGINNQILWALGIALLEIAHWTPLDELKPEGCIDDVVAIRGVAKRKTLLGGTYEAIVRKCLQCNFGCETDLNCAELQAAVYNGVVCPLQDTIEKLEKMGL
ncbi:hypothetical protein F5Y10DRAFT_57969 [Nemania abortiva]|nr:hypothetical protein F5Y10DRAFT_57969 [Nemania abortiva]